MSVEDRTPDNNEMRPTKLRPNEASALISVLAELASSDGNEEDAMPSLMSAAPELPVNDVGESLRHYQEKLGFQVVMTMPEGDYAVVERDGVALLFRNDGGTQSPASIHVFVSGLDDLHAELEARGAQLTQGIIRKPWGNRDFRVADASGNAIKFTEPLDGSV